MKWLLLVILSQPAHADALLDLMLQNSYIDELENDESYTIDDDLNYPGFPGSSGFPDNSEAEWYSWKLQDSEDLVIIYLDDCQ